MRVEYEKEAMRELRGLDPSVRVRIIEKIQQYAAAPQGLANQVTALKGSPGGFRLRVGKWRVLFRLTDDAVQVTSVGSRGSIYR
ncbi:type II toxin-antitoxin system RelE family toxin [Segnochrobactraceae bacterium EtOH-i3]